MAYLQEVFSSHPYLKCFVLGWSLLSTSLFLSIRSSNEAVLSGALIGMLMMSSSCAAWLCDFVDSRRVDRFKGD